MKELSDAAVARAMDVYAEEAGWPYAARVTDFFPPFSSEKWSAEQRSEQYVLLAAADREAEKRSLDLMRRAIEAALSYVDEGGK